MEEQQEIVLERLCDYVDKVLAGKSRVIGGHVLQCAVVVTLENGYYPFVLEVMSISELTGWDYVRACPGAVIFTDKPTELEYTGDTRDVWGRAVISGH